MNWDAIGAMAETAGAVAVVATLFYLALQVRQANTLARRSEMNATMSEISVFRMALARDSDLASVYIKGTKLYDQLDPLEKLRFDSLMGQRFWSYAQFWDRVQTSTFQRDDWETIRGVISVILRDHGSLCWWKANCLQFDASFIAEVDSLHGHEA